MIELLRKEPWMATALLALVAVVASMIARRIARALSTQPDIAGFQVRVAHHESLHPHDAVAHASGGIALG